MKEEKLVFTREQTRILVDELRKFRYSYGIRAKSGVKKPAGYQAAVRLVKSYEAAVNRVVHKLRKEHEKLYQQAHKAIIFGDSRKKIEALLDKLRKMSK